MNKANLIRTGIRLVVTGVAAGVAAYTPAWAQDKVYDALAKGAVVAGSAAAVDLIWAGTETLMASSLEVNGEQVKGAVPNVEAAGVDVSITTHHDAIQTPPTTDSVKTTQHRQQGAGAQK